MNAFLSKWKFTIILVALLLNILLAPMLTSTLANVGIITVDVAFTVLLVVIVLVAGHNKNVMAAYLILAVITSGLAWVDTPSNDIIFSFYHNLFSQNP